MSTITSSETPSIFELNPTIQCNDLKAFERRLMETILQQKPRERLWRIVLAVSLTTTAISSYFWLQDSINHPETNQNKLEDLLLEEDLSFLQSLAKHYFFTTNCIVLIILFVLGIHQRVIQTNIVVSRIREVLYDFALSCDDQAIMSPDDIDKREEFIRRNSEKIIPLIRWLCKTAMNESRDDNLKSKSKSRRTNEQSSNDVHLQNKDVVTFLLESILIISSSATGFIDPQPEDNLICRTVMEEIDFFKYVNTRIFSEFNDNIDRYLGILVNFTRNISFVDFLVKNVILPQMKDFLSKFIEHFRSVQKSRHLFVAYLNNLCQSEEIRCCLIENKLLLSLFDVYDQSSGDVQLRRSIIELIRNCCLDYTFHRQMITEDDQELLVRLVLPLAGGEELPDDEMESLPLDLQYLPFEKERENDRYIRGLLIEAIHQLCTTRYGRELIRKSNIYYHLREYHRWERDTNLLETLMKLIDLVIKKEDEIQHDNLKELVIPDDIIEKFERIDHELKIDEQKKDLN